MKDPDIIKFSKFQEKWFETNEEIIHELGKNVFFIHDNYSNFVKEIIWVLRHSYQNYDRIVSLCDCLKRTFSKWNTIQKKLIELCNQKEICWFISKGIFEKSTVIENCDCIEGWPRDSIVISIKRDDCEKLKTYGNNIPDYISWSENEIISNPFPNDKQVSLYNVAIIFGSIKCLEHLKNNGKKGDANIESPYYLIEWRKSNMGYKANSTKELFTSDFYLGFLNKSYTNESHSNYISSIITGPYDYSRLLFFQELSFNLLNKITISKEHLELIVEKEDYLSLGFILKRLNNTNSYSYSLNNSPSLSSLFTSPEIVLKIHFSKNTELKRVYYEYLSNLLDVSTINAIEIMVKFDLLSDFKAIISLKPSIIDEIVEKIKIPYNSYRMQNYFSRKVKDLSKIQIECPKGLSAQSIVFQNLSVAKTVLTKANVNKGLFISSFVFDDIKFLERILTFGFSINDIDQNGWGPIHIACHHGKLNSIQFILDNGGDINLKTLDNVSPLHLVSQWADAKTYEKFISRGAIEETGPYNPLIVSVYSNNTSLFLYLIAKKKFSFIQDIEDLIRFSIISYNLNILKVLLDSVDCGQMEKSLQEMMAIAVNSDFHEVIVILVNKGVSIDIVLSNQYSVVQTLIYSGSIEILKFLFSKNVVTNYYSPGFHSPIIDCVALGNIEILQMFIDCKFNIKDIKDENGLSCLHWAVLNNSRPMIELLIDKTEKNAQDNNGNCALFYATYIGNIDIIKFLIENGVSCENKNAIDETPIYEAFRRKYWNIVKFLLNHGASIMPFPKTPKSLLHYAVEQNDVELATELIKKKIPIDSKTNISKNTPLHFSCIQNNLQMIELLITNQISIINEQNNQGETPLFLASKHSTPQIVDYLLKNGANPELKDNNSKTPLSVAQNPKIKLLLQMHQKK